MYYQQLVAESKRLEEEIAKTREEIAKYPPGKLLCSHNGKYLKWYSSDGHTSTYIPKSNQNLARQLATREYLSCLLSDLLQKKSFVDSYLNQYNSFSSKVDFLFSKHPAYKQLLSPYFTSQQSSSIDISAWLNSSYPPNPLHPEQLIHRCPSGHIVRSKSESMIDSLLFSNRLPFKYEAPLVINGSFLYPDFTILHPVTMKPVYWEHYGLMDDPAYVRTAISKTQLYISNGIIPNINLIITCETKNNPLTFNLISHMINLHLLGA